MERFEVLMMLATALPWISVWVVASVIAAIRWNRHPVVSALVVTASVIHVLTTIAGRMLPYALRERGVATMGYFSAALGLVGLVGSICIVVAVFIDRQEPGGSSVIRPP